MGKILDFIIKKLEKASEKNLPPHKYEKDTIIKEVPDCGCRFLVAGFDVGRKAYIVEHVTDHDVFAWDIADCDSKTEKAYLRP